MQLWKQGDTLLKDEFNRLILCDHCPCEVDISYMITSDFSAPAGGWTGNFGGSVAGDLMFAIMHTAVSSGITAGWSVPAGWTQIEGGVYNGNWYYSVQYRVKQSGDPTTYHFDIPGAIIATGRARAGYIQGADIPEDSNVATGTSDSPTHPSVTSLGSDRYLLCITLGAIGTATISVTASPSGMTAVGGTGALTTPIWTFEEVVGSGATGVKTATLSGSLPWAAISIIFPPG